MRPAILFPLFADIRTLPGVGPKLEKLIAKVAGPRLVDLIFDLPVGVIDRSYRPKLIAAEAGRIATVEVNVLDHLPPRVKSQPYKVRVSRRYRGDGAGLLPRRCEISDANSAAGFAAPGFAAGSRASRTACRWRIPIMWWRRRMQRRCPQHEPVYGLTEGLTAKTMAKAVRGALERVPQLPEWQDAAFLRQRGFAAIQRRAGGRPCARA